jgi:hypothetical protein
MISEYMGKKICIGGYIIPKKGSTVSAFQIRYGGYKGMVVVHPEKICSEDMLLRPSMDKFDSSHDLIEVVGSSLHTNPSSLCREFISLLSYLGVEDAVFLTLTKSYKQELADMTVDVKKALHYLKRYKKVNPMFVETFRTMLTGHKTAMKEPYIVYISVYILKMLQYMEMHELKSKCNIPIEKSITAFGVIDELGVLKEGEIFVSFENYEKKKYNVVWGPVMITRQPMVYPGDIQMVKAVDHPQLHYLRNVIVFSQFGDRPLPSQLGGGDLDGDKFVVVWDPTLFPKKTCPPLVHQRVEEENTDVTINKVCRFFLEYMENDQLPRISSAILAHLDPPVIPDISISQTIRKILWDNSNLTKNLTTVTNETSIDNADSWKLKSDHEEVLETLALLHASAVDYQKTGVAVHYDDIPMISFPHYLVSASGSLNGGHHSKRILGQIYDGCTLPEDPSLQSFLPDPEILKDSTYKEYVWKPKKSLRDMSRRSRRSRRTSTWRLIVRFLLVNLWLNQRENTRKKFRNVLIVKN